MKDHTNQLLSVIRRGAGTLTSLFFHRRIDDNEIESVRRLAGLIQELSGREPEVSLQDGEWSIVPGSAMKGKAQDGLVEQGEASEKPRERTLNQLLARGAIEQRNIENIAGFALLDSLTSDSDPYSSLDASEPAPIVDETWQSRFFRHASAVSDQEVQQLWGKILSGEVRNPGSYSLKTLSILADLSKDDAEAFQRVAERRLTQIESSTILDPFILRSSKKRRDHWPIPYANILALKSAGLLTVGDSTSIVIPPAESPENLGASVVFLYGERAIIACRPENDKQIALVVTPFTKAGTELSTLVPPKFDAKIREPLEKWESLYNWSIIVASDFSLSRETITYEEESASFLSEIG